MRPLALPLASSLLFSCAVLFVASQFAFGTPHNPSFMEAKSTNPGKGGGRPINESKTEPVTEPVKEETSVFQAPSPSRLTVLVASLTVFVLSIFVGFEIIAKVPPTLHTPLMSGSNAISGITVVGAIIAAGYKETGVGSLLGLVAIVLAMINVVGGFVVTHRMLLMFKKR